MGLDDYVWKESPSSRPGKEKTIVRTFFVHPVPRKGYFSNINEAVAKVRPHDRIEVSAGSFFENVVLGKPVEIVAEPESSGAVELTSHATTLTIESDDVYIEGISFTTMDPKHYSVLVVKGSPLIRQCTLQNLSVVGKGTPAVEKSQIIGSRSHGVYLSDDAGGTYVDNIIERHQWYSIWVESTGSPVFTENFIQKGQHGQVMVSGLQTVGEEVERKAPVLITPSFIANKITDSLLQPLMKMEMPEVRPNSVKAVGQSVAIALGDMGACPVSRTSEPSVGDILDVRSRGAVEVQSTAEPCFERNWVTGSVASGFRFSQGSRGRLVNNKIKNNSGVGILVTEHSHVEMLDNHLEDNVACGLEVSEGASGLAEQNVIKLNGEVGVRNTGGCTKFVLRKSVIALHLKCGVLCTAGGCFALEDNEIRQNDLAGIMVDGAMTNPSAVRNTIMFNEVGVLCTHAGRGVFADNEMMDNRSEAVRVKRLAHPTFRRNRFSLSAINVTVSAHGRGYFEGNGIKDAQKWQVLVTGRSNPTFQGNYIAGGHDDGVVCNDKALGVFTHNVLECHDGANLVVTEMSDPVFDRNVFANAAGEGIRVEGRAMGTFTGNVIKRNRAGGVVVRQGACPVLRKNEISDCHVGGLKVSHNGGGTYEKNTLVHNFHGVVVSEQDEALSTKPLAAQTGPGLQVEDLMSSQATSTSNDHSSPSSSSLASSTDRGPFRVSAFTPPEHGRAKPQAADAPSAAHRASLVATKRKSIIQAIRDEQSSDDSSDSENGNGNGNDNGHNNGPRASTVSKAGPLLPPSSLATSLAPEEISFSPKACRSPSASPSLPPSGSRCAANSTRDARSSIKESRQSVSSVRFAPSPPPPLRSSLASPRLAAAARRKSTLPLLETLGSPTRSRVVSISEPQDSGGSSLDGSSQRARARRRVSSVASPLRSPSVVSAVSISRLSFSLMSSASIEPEEELGQRCTPTFLQNNVRSSHLHGIVVDKGGLSPVFFLNLIDGAKRSGVRVQGDSAVPCIVGNQIRNCREGISCEGAGGFFAANHISCSKEGMQIAGASSAPAVANNVVCGCGVGMHLKEECSPTVSENVVLRSETGILVAGDSPAATICRNVLTENDVGLRVYSVSTCVVEANTFVRNTRAGVVCTEEGAVKEFLRNVVGFQPVGLHIDGKGGVFKQNVIFQHDDAAVRLGAHCSAVLEGNYVHRSACAVHTQGGACSQGQVVMNSMTHNETGVRVSGSCTPMFDTNRIVDNRVGALVEESGGGVFQGNFFVSNETNLRLQGGGGISFLRNVLRDAHVAVHILGSGGTAVMTQNIISGNQHSGVLFTGSQHIVLESNFLSKHEVAAITVSTPCTEASVIEENVFFNNRVALKCCQYMTDKETSGPSLPTSPKRRGIPRKKQKGPGTLTAGAPLGTLTTAQQPKLKERKVSVSLPNEYEGEASRVCAIQVKRNVIRDCEGVAVLVQNGGGHFEGNILHSNRDVCVQCSLPLSNATFLRNTVRHNRQAGVVYEMSAHGSFVENLVASNTRYGLWIRSNANPSASGNTFAGNKDAGIFVSDGGRGVLTKNIFRNERAGGQHNKGKRPVRTHIIVDGEGTDPVVKASDLHNAEWHGVVIRNQARGFIVDNMIRDNQKCGVLVSDDATPVIRGNNVFGNGAQGIMCMKSGGTIENNVIFENQGGGVHLTTLATAVVHDNYIHNEGAGGVRISASLGTFEGNVITSCKTHGLAVTGVASKPLIAGNIFTENLGPSLLCECEAAPTVRLNQFCYNFGKFSAAFLSESAPVFERNVFYCEENTAVFISRVSSETVFNHNVFSRCCTAKTVVPMALNRIESDVSLATSCATEPPQRHVPEPDFAGGEADVQTVVSTIEDEVVTPLTSEQLRLLLTEQKPVSAPTAQSGSSLIPNTASLIGTMRTVSQREIVFATRDNDITFVGATKQIMRTRQLCSRTSITARPSISHKRMSGSSECEPSFLSHLQSDEGDVAWLAASATSDEGDNRPHSGQQGHFPRAVVVQDASLTLSKNVFFHNRGVGLWLGSGCKCIVDSNLWLHGWVGAAAMDNASALLRGNHALGMDVGFYIGGESCVLSRDDDFVGCSYANVMVTSTGQVKLIGATLRCGFRYGCLIKRVSTGNKKNFVSIERCTVASNAIGIESRAPFVDPAFLQDSADRSARTRKKSQHQTVPQKPSPDEPTLAPHKSGRLTTFLAPMLGAMPSPPAAEVPCPDTLLSTHSIRITNCTIKENLLGLAISNATPPAPPTPLDDCSGVAGPVRGQFELTPRVIDSIVQRSNTQEYLVDHSTFYSNGTGILVKEGANPKCVGLQMHRHREAICLEEKAAGFFEKCELLLNENGIVTAGGGFFLEMSVFDSKKVGVTVTDGTPIFVSNLVFDNHDASVILDGGDPLMKQNRIFYGQEAGALRCNIANNPTARGNIIANQHPHSLEGLTPADRRLVHEKDNKELERLQQQYFKRLLRKREDLLRILTPPPVAEGEEGSSLSPSGMWVQVVEEVRRALLHAPKRFFEGTDSTRASSLADASPPVQQPQQETAEGAKTSRPKNEASPPTTTLGGIPPRPPTTEASPTRPRRKSLKKATKRVARKGSTEGSSLPAIDS